ncbi:L-asparaginase [Aequitasia blattaphilus]|uniref:asparaginase n=1 Tax=Aequitasia blattaphilus TaxID=2949332 RepID=A0ABT1ECW3_9FIRM|nr:asparaginase [Aequitasia blattaphilus]MCP1102322.1 asparaginase [Aequitasia blattaphilus]MCR8614962.1 asparaginase [Aequitasia blattaphilus]
MKKILLLATGGTIASLATEKGLSPKLPGDYILEKVPEVNSLCKIEVIQLLNIDSSNMAPDHWLLIAKKITEEYDSYDGFVVLHGTDTMAYTAAALSYLIQDSQKPIVLTGSQKPISNPFTDARLNIYQSVLYAIHEKASHVSIVFHNKVICGTRVRKQRTKSYNAFESMNLPPIATFLEDEIIFSSMAKQEVPHKPRIYTKLNNKVFVLRLTPGLSPEIFQVLKSHYDALVIETFGIGGIPEYEKDDFYQAIKEWVQAGKILLITTQVPEEGLDLSRYEVGKKFSQIPGVLEAGNMTTEAIVVKTMWILGQTTDHERIEKMFYTVINHDRGE